MDDCGNVVVANNGLLFYVCEYVRRFIVAETETMQSDRVDWTLEELWVNEYMDDCESVNDFGARGFLEMMQQNVRKSNGLAVVVSANNFVLRLLDVYFDDDRREFERVVTVWKEKYEMVFVQLIQEFYLFHTNQVDFVEQSFKNQFGIF